MIIEGFEIENWTCIKKLAVSGLPSTGLVVLHGPNRTGKSSLVQALRACLMDYSSTSTALKSRYPRGSAEKPVVSVIFVAKGTTYRIEKCFGSSKSELASRTSTGGWKVETTSAAESHTRTCGYVGGDDSSKGLHQLLWLTQAEFQLPDPKKFDAGVQAQLRGILGVLQTALDDRFIERVRKRWNIWYAGQRKIGKKHEIKDGCKLAEKLERLDATSEELNESDGKFNEMEGLLRQTAELELRKVDLERQLGEQAFELRKRQEEHQQCQSRIDARRFAEQQNTHAIDEQRAALDEERVRAEAAQRCTEDDNAIEPAKAEVTSVGQRANAATERLDQLRKNLGAKRDSRRHLQKQADRTAAKLKGQRLAEKLHAAQRELGDAGSIVQEIAEIEKYLENHPVSDERTLELLKANRQKASRLQADLQATSMNLMLAPETSDSASQLAVDGGPLLDIPFSDTPISCDVRREAELRVGGWGRIKLSRGTGASDLDQIELELGNCNREFADAVNPFGISATDPQALDLLLGRAAEHRVRGPELAKKKGGLKVLAPKGIEALRTKVVELQTQLADIPMTDPGDAEPFPADHVELERLAAALTQQLAAKDEEIIALENEQSRAEENHEAVRQEESAAKEELATRTAKAGSSRAELDRLRAGQEIEQRVREADRAVGEAQSQLEQTALTNDEITVNDRLAAAKEAVRAIQKQIDEGTRKYDVIKGRLLESEGLHSRRASLAARVDELTRLTESESLEKDAVDRLYELFEESREKQLGTLMGPIQDRVLGWMRVLDIGDYKEMRFSDAFMPEKLIRRDGTAELSVDEESTGAQEQIGMLVRLALGSALTSTNEPTVALLDDPLTHCDFGRLSKMRAILRRAAEGDAKLSPPAGPLQIIVLTCHPEWFRDEQATVIDLEDAVIMQRFSG